MCKMKENNGLFDNFSKAKVLADQLVCLEAPLRNKNIITTMCQSLLASYKYLITAMKMMMMKEFIINYMALSLMHEMLKHNGKES